MIENQGIHIHVYYYSSKVWGHWYFFFKWINTFNQQGHIKWIKGDI